MKTLKKGTCVLARTTNRRGTVVSFVKAGVDPYFNPKLRLVPKTTFKDAECKRTDSYIIKYSYGLYGWLTAKNLEVL